jgi:hypothetical protein
LIVSAKLSKMKISVLSVLLLSSPGVSAFSPSVKSTSTTTTTCLNESSSNRRSFFSNTIGATFGAAAALTIGSQPSVAEGDFDVDNFLKSGQVSMPMGVSGQAGKSRPETGIVFRDGSDLTRNSKTGDVLTEILLNANSDDPTAVITTFASPWPLAKGSVYDIECRNPDTGDSAFLSISDKANGKSVSELPSTFFTNKLFASTGRFSFYGPPTDIKVKKSYMEGNNRIIELGFSILSQSTGTEIPRNAIIAATIPEGTDEAVMLVGSSTSTRWRKGTEAAVRKTVDTFKAIPAPKSAMKVRAKVNNAYADLG